MGLRPLRGRRRIRHRRVGGGPALVQRPGGHVRGVVHGLHPVAGGRGPPAAPGGHGCPSAARPTTGRRRSTPGGTFRLALRLGLDGVADRGHGAGVGHRGPDPGPAAGGVPGRPAGRGRSGDPGGRPGHPGSHQSPPRRRLPNPADPGQPAVARPGHLARRDLRARGAATTPTGGRSTRPPTTAPSTCRPSTSAAGTTSTWTGSSATSWGCGARRRPSGPGRRSGWSSGRGPTGRRRCRSWATSTSGPAAVLDPTADAPATGSATGCRTAPSPDWAPVRIFVMGENAWRDEQEWPLARTRYTPWYLRPGGRLRAGRPGGGEPPDTSPTTPGSGAHHRRPAARQRRGRRAVRPAPSSAERADVLSYTSEPLAGPMELTGPVRVELWVVHRRPRHRLHGRADRRAPRRAARGTCARERSGPATPALPVPLAAGAVYQFTVDLSPPASSCRPATGCGCTSRSSSFPEWEPNPIPDVRSALDTDADLRPAHQQALPRRPPSEPAGAAGHPPLRRGQMGVAAGERPRTTSGAPFRWHTG